MKWGKVHLVEKGLRWWSVEPPTHFNPKAANRSVLHENRQSCILVTSEVQITWWINGKHAQAFAKSTQPSCGSFCLAYLNQADPAAVAKDVYFAPRTVRNRRLSIQISSSIGQKEIICGLDIHGLQKTIFGSTPGRGWGRECLKQTSLCVYGSSERLWNDHIIVQRTGGSHLASLSMLKVGHL